MTVIGTSPASRAFCTAASRTELEKPQLSGSQAPFQQFSNSPPARRIKLLPAKSERRAFSATVLGQIIYVQTRGRAYAANRRNMERVVTVVQIGVAYEGPSFFTGNKS
jgi:hypothetical protein